MPRWTRRSVFITMMLCLLSFLPVQAQGNLLQNPGFESDYSGRMGRGDFNFPSGWDGWFSESPHTEYWMNVPPTGYPHSGPFRRSGTNSQSIAKGGGSFTAAALQQVSNIPAGAVVRGSAFVYLENNDGTNAQVRIGIGSNVGTNPTGAITWSDWEKRLNGHHQISVEHVATGGDVTLFIYATQTWANDPNAVYIDDASLTIVGSAEVSADEGDGGGGNNVVVEPPRPSGVAFVKPQSSDSGGAITHVVGSGDTLASIAVAYGVKIDEIIALNGLDPSLFLQLNQQLIISNSDSTQTQSQSQSTENNSEVATSSTEEVAQVPAPPTGASTDEPSNILTLFDPQDDTLLRVILVTQHSLSVNIGQAVDNTASLTFADNQFRAVQVMPEFTGGDIPLGFWKQFWVMNPDFVIQNVMLILDNFTVTLSLSALVNEANGSITYTAVIESVKNAQGGEVNITAITQSTYQNPDVYFQPDEAFYNAMSEISGLGSSQSAG